LKDELPFESSTTERFEYPDLRMKYSKKFQLLKINSLFDNCCQIVQKYIYLTIPYPKRTEYSFWSCSCLPGTDRALIRVNIFWQETLTIFEEQYTYKEDGIEKPFKALVICISLSKSKLFETYTSEQLFEKYKALIFSDAIYRSGGQDQLRVELSEMEFLDFLDDIPIRDAIKEFNLRLMRKGGCMFNRYHCFDVADQAFRTDNLI